MELKGRRLFPIHSRARPLRSCWKASLHRSNEGRQFLVSNQKPSVPEVFLALGGVALAAALIAIALKALRLLPEPCTDSSSPPPTSHPARPR